jgi:osmotically-inducible protein OsmY
MALSCRFEPVQTCFAAAMSLCLILLPAVTATAAEVLDTEITQALNTLMWSDDAVSANTINVSTAEGIVNLTGTVETILAKDRAQAIAQATVGVRAVVNRIDVQPYESWSDRDLTRAVRNAWLADPAVYSYKLEANADDGILTLSGTVDSYAKKDLAAAVAKGVKGVQGIENEIAVDYTTDRPDVEIQREIESRLEYDVRVDDGLIDVTVNEGRVTLSGTVGSLQEKNQAGRDAWVAGVVSVDMDDLRIEWWARDTMRRSSGDLVRTDAQIRRAVEDALLYDPRVLSFQPEVHVANNTVTLTGTVDNLAAKQAAEQTAGNTVGVWRVRNHLKVRAEIPSDDELHRRVSRALLNDPYVDRFDISIAAHNGWVNLSGSVNTSFEKNRAETIASLVRGVVGVDNTIDHDYRWVWKPDWEILADVNDHLRWSPFVDESDITVTVVDGEVSLSGTVGSWTEREEAEKKAYQAGAKDVDNLLEVEFEDLGPYGPSWPRIPF